MGTTMADIVTVSITRETKPVSQKGLGITLIVGPNASFSDATRIKYYGDLPSIAADLTNGVDDPEYKMAAVIFAQNPRVLLVAIGKKIAGDADYTESLNAISVVSNDFYGVLVVSRADADQLDVAAWVIANERITALANSNTSIINSSEAEDSLQVAKLVFSDDLSTGNATDISVNSVAMLPTVYLTSHLDTMNEIAFNLSALANTSAILDPADATNRTLIVTYTAGNIIINSATVTSGSAVTIAIVYASLPVQLKAAGNDRTSCIFTSDALNNFPDAGLLGKILPLTPGSYTGMFKSLSGVTTDVLTPTQTKNAHDKYCSTYETVGVNNMLIESWVSTGEFIDIIVFQDWLKNRITENVFSVLVNKPKVPYTDNGIADIENAVKQILQIGLNNGGISPFTYNKTTKEQTGGFYTTVPLAADVPDVDKNARVLRNVNFVAWLAGAIHTVQIDGVLTV